MENPATTSNKIHTWMIVLLVWILALLIFIAGYMLYGKTDVTTVPRELSGTELAVTCEEAGFVDETTVSREEKDSTVCPEPENPAFPGTTELPSFTYPLGWQLWVQRDLYGYDTLIGNNGPVTFVKDSDGISKIFEIVGGLKTQLPMNEFPTATESAGDMTVTTLPNGTLTTVKNVTNDFDGGLEEFIFFVGANSAVKITIPDRATSRFRDELDLIVNSLDFSKIE